jgi:hypothetical protein
MGVSRFVVPLLVGMMVPLAASARETYQFSPVPPNARGVDTHKLQAIVPKLQIANATVGSVGPSGGSLKLNGLVLEFPKGAVTKTTKVQWVTLRHPDIVFGWMLEPRDLKLAKPLTLHSPKADLVFRMQRLGAYVLLADRKAESFQLVTLAMAPAPTKVPPKGKPAAKGSAPKTSTVTPKKGQAPAHP